MSWRHALWLLSALLLLGCIGTRIQSWQADEFARVQPRWHYYRWADPPLAAPGNYQETMLSIDRAVRGQLDTLLAERGYVQHAQRAQFEVDYRLGDESVVGLPGPLSPTDEPERILAGPNAQYQVSSRFYTHRTLDYHEVSHLRLTVYDIQSRRIVWQRSASKLVDNPSASAASVGDRAGKTTRKLLKGFPAAGQQPDRP
jgi:hypothetical protein